MFDNVKRVVGLFALVPACATVMYDGPRRSNQEVATIVAAGTRVTRIDGRDSAQVGGAFMVLPGTHFVAAYLNEEHRVSRLPLAVCFEAERGHTYRTQPRYTDDQHWDLQIVDDLSFQPVAVRRVESWSQGCVTAEAFTPSPRSLVLTPPPRLALTPPALLTGAGDGTAEDSSSESAATAPAALPGSVPAATPAATPLGAISAAAAETQPAPTRRPVSGVALGFWTGPSALGQGAADGAAIGSGHWGARLNLDVVLWDHVPLSFSVGRLRFDDNKPFTEVVMECTTDYGVVLGCGNPMTQSSEVLATLLSVETGYQHRFSPSPWLSLLPAALVGYTWNPGGLKREIVGCDDCKTISVHGVRAGGAYVSPSFKIAFSGWWAIGIRSEIYWTGNLAYRALMGAEIGKF